MMIMDIQTKKTLVRIDVPYLTILIAGIGFLFLFSCALYVLLITIYEIVCNTLEIEYIFINVVAIFTIIVIGWIFLGANFIDAIFFYRQMKGSCFDEEKLIIYKGGKQEILLWNELISIQNQEVVQMIKTNHIRRIILIFSNNRTVAIPSCCRNHKKLLAHVKNKLEVSESNAPTNEK